jgi:hypothetical protein
VEGAIQGKLYTGVPYEILDVLRVRSPRASRVMKELCLPLL